jgi:hypothetical protein
VAARGLDEKWSFDCDLGRHARRVAGIAVWALLVFDIGKADTNS